MKSVLLIVAAILTSCGGVVETSGDPSEVRAPEPLAGDAGEDAQDAHPEDARRVCIGYICPDASQDN